MMAIPSTPSRDVAHRAELEEASSPDALIVFLTVVHPAFDAPLRIVSDPLDYVYAGELHTGLVFGWGILDDTDSAAQAQITLPDTDQRIGAALRQASGEARVSALVLSTADFDLSVVPREPIGTPIPVYAFGGLVLLSASGDGQQIACTVGLRDYTQEPWPCIYATEMRLPGLYR